MNRKEENQFRDKLVSHLKGGQAFASIDSLLDKMPYNKVGIVHDGLPYSFYQQFYHIRFAQLDVLKYCLDSDYETPEWPDDYWPDQPKPENENEWEELITNYFNERDQFCNLIKDQSKNLLQPFDQNPDHNLLRQAELIIEHSAYHIGQLHVIFRIINF